jgi:hypothetical protein
MSPELEKLQALMLHHAKNVLFEYQEKWIPSSEHIALGLELFKPPMPGFNAYDVDDAIRRNDIFFRCRLDWVVGCKHNFSVFVKHFAKWIAVPVGTDRIRPSSARTSPALRETCSDHPGQQLVNGICEICYPKCDKCGNNHDARETCDGFKKRDAEVKRLFRVPSVETQRAASPMRGTTTTLSGDEVFDEKAKKEFKEIRMQQERQR